MKLVYNILVNKGHDAWGSIYIELNI